MRENLALLNDGAPGFSCVARCASAEEAWQRLPASAPDVGFMDNGDRFGAACPSLEISDLEQALSALGYGEQYCAAIRARVTGQSAGAHAAHLYKAALQRTLAAKRKAQTIC